MCSVPVTIVIVTDYNEYRTQVCSPSQTEIMSNCCYYSTTNITEYNEILKSLTRVFRYVHKSHYSASHFNPPNCDVQRKV